MKGFCILPLDFIGSAATDCTNLGSEVIRMLIERSKMCGTKEPIHPLILSYIDHVDHKTSDRLILIKRVKAHPSISGISVRIQSDSTVFKIYYKVSNFIVGGCTFQCHIYASGVNSRPKEMN